MSIFEKMTTAKIMPKKRPVSSKWNLIRDVQSEPEHFQIRAFFENGGITFRLEPRIDISVDEKKGY